LSFKDEHAFICERRILLTFQDCFEDEMRHQIPRTVSHSKRHFIPLMVFEACSSPPVLERVKVPLGNFPFHPVQ
jgi:hypothetical protein